MRWAEVHECVHQPAEERLDDLLWELARYGAADLPSNLGRLERVRSAAVALCAEIYGKPALDLDEHLEARRLRHDAATSPAWTTP